MTESRKPLRPAERPLRAPGPGEALIRIAGCGLCHTDLGYLYDGVPTRGPRPLILGHEISGAVEAAGAGFEQLVGKAVVVPAVLPCGECALCKAGRFAICKKQVMPGNDCDGGFADRVLLPARWLCPVPGADADDFDARLGEVPGLTLRHLAVVADAVSTAWMSVRRACLRPGDFAVVTGLGGVGSFVAQFAADAGAIVAGLDVDTARRDGATALGVGLALDPRALDAKAVRAALRDFAKSKGCADTEWKIFECSGTTAGQTSAWGLLNPGATLMVVGYTAEPVSVRLSNLMAFDAKAQGNWGCDPGEYPALLERVLSGRVKLVDQVELRPMATLPRGVEEVHGRKAKKRLIFCPGELA